MSPISAARLDELFGAPIFGNNLVGIIGLGGRTPKDPWPQMCAVKIRDVCQGRATNGHHTKLRGQGGTNGRVVPVCGSGTTGCHGWLHHNRDAARELGWIEG